MILGIGADIIEIKRLKLVLKKNPKILERLFTQKELEKAKSLSGAKKSAYYAKRFTAKEALSKACGSGIGKDLNWQDMEILNDRKGAPVATFSKKSCQILQKKFKTKKIKVFISLSDEKDFALAFVILTK